MQNRELPSTQKPRPVDEDYQIAHKRGLSPAARAKLLSERNADTVWTGIEGLISGHIAIIEGGFSPLDSKQPSKPLNSTKE